jgi:hypothetical protein
MQGESTEDPRQLPELDTKAIYILTMRHKR